MRQPLRAVLADKGGEVHMAAPETLVSTAVRVMNALDIGSLMILGGGRLVGIFTERDVLKRVVEPGRDPSTTRVGEVMTTGVQTADPEMTVEEAMRQMTLQRVRHLPVVLEDKLLGLVSIGDLTRWVTRELEFEVQSLETYVTGRYPA